MSAVSGILEPIAYYCATPRAEDDGTIVAEISSQYAREVTSVFLERWESSLSANSGSLVQVLRTAIEGDMFDSRLSWSSAVGNLRRSLFSSDGETAHASAVRFALWLAESGFECSWRTKFVCRGIMHGFGHAILPSRDLTVEAEEGSASVICGRGRGAARLEFTHNDDVWTLLAGHEARRVLIEIEHIPVWRADNPSDMWQLAEYELHKDLPEVAIQSATDSFAPNLRSALIYLNSVSSIYVPWIRRVLTELILLRDEPESMHSSSQMWRPGAVAIADRNGPHSVAELAGMLVHESSHQYLYLIRTLGDLVDGTDNSLYYSPVKGFGRPIEAILTAYHAFANILLMYKRVLSSETATSKDDFLRDSFRNLRDTVDIMERHLQDTGGLTVLGESLWRELSTALKAE